MRKVQGGPSAIFLGGAALVVKLPQHTSTQFAHYTSIYIHIQLIK